MDQLSDELLYPLISVLIGLVRVTRIAISTPVATSLPHPVATHPSVATPAQLATPACIALPGAVANMISAHTLDPFSNDPLPVPQAAPSSAKSSNYATHLLSFLNTQEAL